MIGWWESTRLSSWFFRRLNALDTHFRDRVSEYEQYKVGGIRVQLFDSRGFQSKQNGSLHMRSKDSQTLSFGTSIHSIQGQIFKPHSGYGLLGSIHFFPRPLKGKWSLLSGLVENLGVVGIFLNNFSWILKKENEAPFMANWVWPRFT